MIEHFISIVMTALRKRNIVYVKLVWKFVTITDAVVL